MANIKLTDNNWEASGVYDLAQQKTQRQINADVNTALGNKAGKAVIAPDYSASSTYAVGDYVMYNGSLYRCSTAISTAEAWTAAHWTESKIGTDVSALKSALKSGDEEDAIYHLGFYLDENGDLCQVEEETNNG